MRNKIQTNKYNSGFTLVEIMVSLSIFMIVMLVAIGSLVIATNTANKAKKMRFAMDNLNFAMESMSRNIRMGTNYTCSWVNPGNTVTLQNEPAPSDCNPGNVLIFIPPPPMNQPENRLGYIVDVRNDGTHTLKRCDQNDDCVDIVSPEIDVQLLKFFVNGSYNENTIEPDDLTQPSVYIIMKGAINIRGVWTAFTLQTMASQRSAE